MFARQPPLVPLSVCTDVLLVTEREVADGLLNGFESSILSHGFCAALESSALRHYYYNQVPSHGKLLS